MLPISFEQVGLLAAVVALVIGLVALARVRSVLVRLEKRCATQNSELVLLQQNQQAMNQSVVGMGKKIRHLTQRLGEAEQRNLFTPGDEASYQQAARLVSLGASAGELMDHCGMARAEAELLVTLKGRAH
ncbi:DUF2802 domain-containing protein [Oceanobacter antarcticus]|jgi:uncharacterized coiled-coil protein SlyX|uniref:DUF2802 domain-containing protein n=1 Tax=Oceanobacter antarcticus TaxID=3133425 RepID=A0ABW8NLP5_9GAMM